MDATAQSSTTLRNGAFVGLGLAALAFGVSKTAVGASIGTQLAYEVAHCTANKAKLFGFIGACCNWFLGLSALYDATQVSVSVSVSVRVRARATPYPYPYAYP